MKVQKVLVTLFVSLYILAANSFAQSANITAKVVDQYDEPITDATITLIGKGTTLSTDTAGTFSIATGEVDSVAFSKSGYESQTFAIKDTSVVLKVNKVFGWKDLLNPLFYIRNGGLWIVLFIVFAETGLMIGFFLPGDSLLFVAGIYSKSLVDSVYPGGTGSDLVDLIILVLLVSFCGIVGNMVGYWFGKKSGPFLFTRKDTVLFKKKHLLRAKEFYDKHGGQAIVFARFLPIVRTFAPIIAGIVSMERKKFMYYNVLGCVAWVVAMLFGGHYLDKFFMRNFGFDLKQHLELIVLGIVLVTTLPVLYKLFFGKRPVVNPETPEPKQ